jgi:RNA polymerase sigma-70 factor (ECF subfamily)
MDAKFEKLYKDNAKYVYNVALGILRNQPEAEDVMQNVFIKLFENYDSFEGRSSIKTYLYRMTVNRSIDYIRSQSLKGKKLEEIRPETEASTGTDTSLLDVLMSKLNPDLRTPVLLSEIGGFSYKEIADILNINLGTVKSRINRGMAKLKELAAKEALK